MAKEKRESNDPPLSTGATQSKKTPTADEQTAIRPLKRKVPEGDANLRKREEWFQKRAGGKPRT